MILEEWKMCHRIIKILVLLNIFVVLVDCQSKNFSPNPIGGRFVPVIRPSQSLLPPHREEGQSLDDIIFGFSSPLLTPPKSLPSITTTSTTQRSNVFITTTTPAPPPPQTSQGPFIPTNSAFGNVANSGRFNNNNLVQTFTPPAPLQSQRFSPTPSVPVRNSVSPSINSAEEIKVPQPVKLRNQKKQYTKADLVAAANSLKPAGFDFSKVLIFTPNNFENNITTSPPAPRNFQSKNVERVEDNSLSPLYNHIMFPLPLFDTPVFRPIMEMLLRQQQARLGSLTTSDNKKVLVIIPKSAGLGAAINSARSANNNGVNRQQQRDQRSNQNQSQSKPQQVKFSPVKPTSPTSTSTSHKFVASTKSGKFVTTSKPKSNFVTTKRVAKQVGHSHHVGKTKEKGPDLQVAATSNKLSQRPNGNGNGNPSSTEKRSYSIKGDDKYSFSYAVKNDAFGDVKSHKESRDGDQVEGEYSMLEADGYTRVVRYTVDSDQGFKASVRRIPPS